MAGKILTGLAAATTVILGVLAFYKYFAEKKVSLRADVYPSSFALPYDEVKWNYVTTRLDLGSAIDKRIDHILKSEKKLEGDKLFIETLNELANWVSQESLNKCKEIYDLIGKTKNCEGFVKAYITNDGELPAKDVRFIVKYAQIYAIEENKNYEIIYNNEKGISIPLIPQRQKITVLAWTRNDDYRSWLSVEDQFILSHLEGIGDIEIHIPSHHFFAFLDKNFNSIMMILIFILLCLLIIFSYPARKHNVSSKKQPEEK